MNDNIRRLVRLQDIEFEMKALRELQEQGPVRASALDADFHQRVEQIGADRLKHEGLVRLRHQLYLDRDEIQQKLQSAQQRLAHVNNQREYSAALNEIDANKSHLTGIEDRILEAESGIEALAGPAAEADRRIAEEQAQVEADKQKIQEELATAGARLAELEAQRGEITAHLPQDYLQRFDTIFKARGGIALARVKDGACAACHVRLRPHLINLARRGDELVYCDSCRRILYHDDSVPGEPGADHDAAGPAPQGDAAAQPGH
ncbi:MAG: hypothetical protein KBD01_10940 [Acidobacteria bacterium]|nr:hypothetical protein [Acidobacteriota bacterium]